MGHRLAEDAPLVDPRGRNTMSRQLPQSGRAITLVLVGLMLLVIPAGLSLGQGPTVSSSETNTVVTPTLPPVNLTGTPTPTPTPNPDGDENNSDDTNNTDGDETTGQTLVVGGVAGDVTSEMDCNNAEYTTIQKAVDDAKPGDTVRVCEGRYSESVTVETANLTIRSDGRAMISSTNESAVRITAPGVTLSGFTITVDRSVGKVIEVGARNTLIRDNTVDAPRGVGIFLSDGLTSQGEPDPELGTATGSHVVNNSVQAYNFRIWSDADRTVIRDNNVSDRLETDTDRKTCEDARKECENANHSIVSTGNGTVIRSNTVRYSNHPIALYDPNGTAILLGGKIYHRTLPERPGHNWANNNSIIDNTVDGAPEDAIQLLHVATGSVVRNNTLTDNVEGIRVWSNETIVRNNTVARSNYWPHLGVVIVGRAKVINNTITKYYQGLVIAGHAKVIGNTITNNGRDGVFFSLGGCCDWYPANGSGRLLNNTITGNARYGISIEDGTPRSQIEIHYNRIQNNGELGIYNFNPDKSDGDWPIVNATNNYWDCGGPSGDLEDPYTGRIANGTGDTISVGDEPGVSNVHFDPFLELSGCSSQSPSSTSNPTSTPTPMSTATSTPTPTPSGLIDETVGDGNTSNEASGDSGGEIADDGRLIGGSDTTNDSTNATPPSGTPTVSPTPVVEPGFGVIPWFVGWVILFSLLAIRSRVNRGGSERYD